MISKTTFALLAAALILPDLACSETTPPRTRYDERVRKARYVDGQVYTVELAPTRATTIEFEDGETIVSIVAGDTSAFKFEGVPGDRVFAIKPMAAGVETNVTVYTSQRSYYFRLVTGHNAFYAVRFSYPNKTRHSSRATKRAVSSRSYGVSHKTSITPNAIWDDGTFTYFRFKKNAPIPAIFRVVAGRERSVNSTSAGDGIMRVSGTSQQWALRLGDEEVCIAEMKK